MITVSELHRYLNITVTAWVTATEYNKGDIVSNGGTEYECIIKHTSGTFSTDLTALKWSTDLTTQSAADYAIERVNSYLNTDFRSGTYTEKFFGEGLDTYHPKVNPVNTVTGIESFNESTNAFETIFATGDSVSNSVIILEAMIKLYNGYSFAKDVLHKLVYTGGETANAFIKGCCLEIGAIYFKKQTQGLLGLTSRNMAGQGTESAGFNFDDAVKNILESLLPYRRVNI